MRAQKQYLIVHIYQAYSFFLDFRLKNVGTGYVTISPGIEVPPIQRPDQSAFNRVHDISTLKTIFVKNVFEVQAFLFLSLAHLLLSWRGQGL